MTDRFRSRFEELENEIKLIEISMSRTIQKGRVLEAINAEIFNKWRVNVKNLLTKTCGLESVHYKDFLESEKSRNFDTEFRKFERLKPVFLAAKEDYFGGYIIDFRMLVQAEVFDDELEQANELLNKNYFDAAAIIGRVVLETWIKELCKKNNIELAKLNKMNDDLAKAGVYNSIIQKQILALSAIGNSAAHGKKDEYSREQVKDMLNEIKTLLASSL